MKRATPKQFAEALCARCIGKKKHDIKAVVRSFVLRFGMTGKLKFLGRVQQALAELLDAEKGLQRAVVRVPQCDEKKARQWTAIMTKHTKCNTELSFVSDPSLIAGAIFTVANKRYDGSVRTRLRRLKEHLIALS